MAEKEHVEQAKNLATMVKMDESICLDVLRQCNNNYDDALDNLLNLNNENLKWGKDSVVLNEQNDYDEQELEYQQQLKEINFENEQMKTLENEKNIDYRESLIVSESKNAQKSEHDNKILTDTNIFSAPLFIIYHNSKYECDNEKINNDKNKIKKILLSLACLESDIKVMSELFFLF